MSMNATGGKIFVLVPGAWSGAWIWEPVAHRLRAVGHTVYPMTLTGLAPDASTTDVGLQTHVQDVLALLHRYDLRNVTLVGHSYSGIVAGSVVDQAPDRVAHTVFVEAFLPRHGQSLLDAFGPGRAEEIRQIESNHGRWPAPVADDLAGEPDLTPEHVRYLRSRFVDHPGRTVRDPAVMRRRLSDLRATYASCGGEDHWPAGEVEALSRSGNWDFRRLDAGHFPMITIPDDVVSLLHEAD